MSPDIIWEDPPSQGSGAGKYRWFFDELRRHTGKWAVAPFSKASASSASNAKMKGTEGDSWEVVTRRVADPDRPGKYVERVYARHTGKAKVKKDAGSGGAA